MDRFAAVVNEIPAITHNYVRSHQYNVWFTVIGKSEQEIQDVVHDLEQRTNLIDTHILNAKKMFKINTVMKNVVSAPDSNYDPKAKSVAGLNSSNVSQDIIASCATTKQSNAVELSESDRARFHLLSGDIPHSLTPFTDLQTNPGDFLSAIKEDLSSKRMRRFGAILRHQQAGFAENAMVCFCIGSMREFRGLCQEDHITSMDVAEAGAILAAESFVSHCYEREAFKAFPYNVYAMVHASSPEDLQAKIQTLVRKLNNPEYAVLHSVRELKKTSFRF